jgi:hypothetical protein
MFCSFGVRRGKTRHTSRRAQQRQACLGKCVHSAECMQELRKKRTEALKIFSCVLYEEDTDDFFVVRLCVDISRIL